MAGFSVGETATSGFGLIARKPLALLAWALAYAVITYAPMAAGLLWFASDWQALMQLGRDIEAGGDPTQLLGKLGAFAGAGLLWLIWLLFGYAVLYAAVNRAVLSPRDSAFGYLRLGGDELRFVLLFLLYFVLALPFVAIFALAAGAGAGLAGLVPEPWTGLARFAAIMLAILAFIWICVRLSLAAPMTFAEKKVRLFESWRVTKGRFWKLLGLALLMILICLAVAIVFGIVFFLVMAVTGAASGALDLEAMAKLGETAAPETVAGLMAPMFIAMALLDIVSNALFLAITVAPWAVAYRELSGGGRAENPEI